MYYRISTGNKLLPMCSLPGLPFKGETANYTCLLFLSFPSYYTSRARLRTQTRQAVAAAAQ